MDKKESLSILSLHITGYRKLVKEKAVAGYWHLLSLFRLFEQGG